MIDITSVIAVAHCAVVVVNVLASAVVACNLHCVVSQSVRMCSNAKHMCAKSDFVFMVYLVFVCSHWQ